jgi:hypothetical protein
MSTSLTAAPWGPITCPVTSRPCAKATSPRLVTGSETVTLNILRSARLSVKGGKKAMLYVPAGTVKLNTPKASVLSPGVDTATPVAATSTSTSSPATGCPDGPTTRPVSVAASAGDAIASSANANPMYP